MKRVAISIRQPWLWLIMRPDIIGDEARRDACANKEIKDVENRSRAIKFSGEVYLHCSRTPADNYDTLRLDILNKHGITVPTFEELKKHTGGIIAKAMFENPVEESDSPWFLGPFAYKIFSVEPVRFAECKGTVTPLFWDVPEDLRLTA